MVAGVGGCSVYAGKVATLPAGSGLRVGFPDDGDATLQESLKNALSVFKKFVELRPSGRSSSVEDAANRYRELGFDFRYYDTFLCRRSSLVAGFGRMLSEISSAGTRVYLDTSVLAVRPADRGFLVTASSPEGFVEINAKRVILAVGRSGHRLVRSLSSTFSLEGRASRYDAGVRLEFPAELWPDIDRHHGDLKLLFGNARTFCMCKNGFVVAYRLGDAFLLDGYAGLDVDSGFTNIAVTTRRYTDSKMAQPDLVTDIADRVNVESEGKPVRQTLSDYLGTHRAQNRNPGNGNLPSSLPFWRWGNVDACFPEDVAREVRKAVGTFAYSVMPAKARACATVLAPELHYYLLRLPLAAGFESRRSGMYVVGDCTGGYRGVLQAMCSGMYCGERIAGSEDV